MNVKTVIHGDLLSMYYAQTLCLMLYPRAKFPDGLDEDHVPRVDLYADLENGIYKAKVCIRDAQGVFEGEFSSPAIEKIYMETSAFVMGRAFIKAAVKSGMKPGPWGLLTGIRPAKPFLNALMNGNDISKIERLLTEDYLVSPEKASLCRRLSEREFNAVKSIKKDSCSIYISIPFCPTRCAYCSFVSYALPNLMALIPEYIEHLCSDIRNTARTVSELGLNVSCIYVGGGTPTTLDSEQLRKLLTTISECFDTEALDEFCVEAGRPDTIDEEKLEILRAYGVNRISINPQTLHDDTLKLIGRRHSVNDFFKAYDKAKRSGIESKNVDLIFGLPSETEKDLQESVNGILELEPENITVHTFCVKKSADLANDENALSVSKLEEAQRKAFELIEENGYFPYYIYRQKNAVENLENIGFTKDGFEGIYNIVMMEEIHSVIGIGAGASTRLVGRKGEIVRHYSPKYPFEYKDFSFDQTLLAIKEFYDKIY